MGNDGDIYQEAIEACIENGKRLVIDAETLRDFASFSTSKALAIIAQEEFAKAYLLRLVQEGAVPWSDEIFKATRDHHCKQLIGIVMEYLFTPWESKDLLERDKSTKDKLPDFLLPAKVADALNIFCHEKIARWNNPSSYGDIKYDFEAKRIWKGQLEKNKQDAIYIGLGKDGEIKSIPLGDSDDANKHIEYAKVLEEVSTGQDWCFAFTEREYIKSSLKRIFESIYKK